MGLQKSNGFLDFQILFFGGLEILFGEAMSKKAPWRQDCFHPYRPFWKHFLYVRHTLLKKNGGCLRFQS